MSPPRSHDQKQLRKRKVSMHFHPQKKIRTPSRTLVIRHDTVAAKSGSTVRPRTGPTLSVPKRCNAPMLC